MSWLGWLNFLLLQWLGFRLARVEKDGTVIGYKIIGPVVPLTGWWSDYIWLDNGV